MKLEYSSEVIENCFELMFEKFINKGIYATSSLTLHNVQLYTFKNFKNSESTFRLHFEFYFDGLKLTFGIENHINNEKKKIEYLKIINEFFEYTKIDGSLFNVDISDFNTCLDTYKTEDLVPSLLEFMSCHKTLLNSLKASNKFCL